MQLWPYYHHVVAQWVSVHICSRYRDGPYCCVHQDNVRDSHARSNACWKCGGLGHFQKDCKDTLNPQSDDRDDAALSDTNPIISQMSHTLTTSMPIADLTFKAILKELFTSAISNRRAFHPKLTLFQKLLHNPLQAVLIQMLPMWWPLWLALPCSHMHPYLLHVLLVLLRLGIKQ